MREFPEVQRLGDALVARAAQIYPFIKIMILT